MEERKYIGDSENENWSKVVYRQIPVKFDVQVTAHRDKFLY